MTTLNAEITIAIISKQRLVKRKRERHVYMYAFVLALFQSNLNNYRI